MHTLSPAWTAALTERGITLLPASTSVPVELYALLPDGRALHFRARGTSVTLHLYAASDVVLAVAVDEPVLTHLPVTGEVWHPLGGPVGGTRAVLTAGPLAGAEIDGRERFGWSSHEAGLLRGVEALPLLDELLDVLVPAGRFALAV